MNSPLDFFFKLGNKISSDPNKQADFTYYMFWIMFLAFAGMFVVNVVNFIRFLRPLDLIWCAVGFAIASLQFFNLKSFYKMRKARKEIDIKPEEEDKIENVKDMLGGFEKK